MPPFSQYPLITGFKDKVDALHLAGNALYLAYGNGHLNVYDLKKTDSGRARAKLRVTKKALAKKAIEQLGVLPDKRQLVVLSDSLVTLYNQPDIDSPQVLTQARTAQSFGISSSYQDVPRVTGKGKAKATDETDRTLVTTLVVGCRKRVVVYTWLNGVLGPVRELALPHSPRLILFPRTKSPSLVHLAVSPTEFLILRIPLQASKALTFTEGPAIVAPGTQEAPPSGAAAKVPGMGALSGLGGYVGKGLGALGGRTGQVLMGAAVGDGELLVVREGRGIFVDGEGKVTREEVLEWALPPEDIAACGPYIISALPSAPSSAASTSASAGGLQFRLAPTLAIQQTLGLPSSAPSASSPAAASSTANLGSAIRALSVGSAGGPATEPVFVHAAFVATPLDKLQLQTDGSSIFALEQTSLRVQLDELIALGRYEDAMGVVDVAADDSDIDKPATVTLIRTLQAVAMFSTQQWEPAMDAFVSLDVTPARVIALFPEETVSGRLHVGLDQWVETFGGPKGGRLVPESDGEKSEGEASEKSPGSGLLRQVPHLAGLKKRPSLDSMRDKDKASIAEQSIKSSAASVVEYEVCPPAALEALSHYLSDRRQKIAGAMASLTGPLPSSSNLPPLTSVPKQDLLDLPSIPIGDLEPEQLLRVAQLVYTALLKVYLAIRPTLVGSLCRIENWCEVDEVEKLLRAREKYSDLVDLYKGKGMHEKALVLLKELSASEDDPLDKYDPTIRYLQKLGPSHLDLIFAQSKWVFEENPRLAQRIFTADEAEVEALPRHRVAQFLERTDRVSCIAFLERIINELGEQGPDMHDKLAGQYLEQARAEASDSSGTDGTWHHKLLDFLQASEQYRPDRLLGRLSPEELPRARAILLGRLGNHEAALHIYVTRLDSLVEAEEYCSRIYASDPNPTGVFLTLLRIYLRPSKQSPVHLEPALRLIASQGVRIDAQKALALLPPMVTMRDVQSFFVRTLRDGHARRDDTRVVKSLLKARRDQVDRGLMALQQRKVRITDTRICPQCHKRIGQSVIAVHAPRGEVTHYQCKDAFSVRLNAARG